MKRVYEDLTNRRFGMLTVVSRAENRGHSIMWNCQCDCGSTSVASSSNLRNGTTRSCGCQRIKHGKKGTRLYNIWGGMKARCYRKSHIWYKRYGGRGITICDEWVHDFQAFYDWAMANGYRDGLTIDRIDNDRGYSPDNCRWATEKQQKNNRTSFNVVVEIHGKAQTLAQWAEETGILYTTLYRRYTAGLRGENLIAKTQKHKARHIIRDS